MSDPQLRVGSFPVCLIRLHRLSKAASLDFIEPAAVDLHRPLCDLRFP